MEYGRFVPHEHELAELCRRDHDVVLLPDGRAHGSAVRECRRRYRCRHRARPRLRSPELTDDRQLLGGHHPLLLYILLPIAFVGGLIFVGQGAVQTLSGPVHIHDALNGMTQTIAVGPVGFMEAIKQLGTNGGGFFNANGAHPFENPTGLTNLLSFVLLLCIPFALTYTFGKMVRSIRQGGRCWPPWSSSSELGRILLLRRTPGNPAVAAAGIKSQPTGNMEGKEVRFGDTAVGPLRHRLDADLDGQRRRGQRLLHADGRLRAADRHDARRGHPWRHRKRPVHDPSLSPSSRCSSAA